MTVLTEAIEQSHLELAQRKHTPTKAMQVVAKRGVRLSQGKNVDPVAMQVGRRVASGQTITDDHVTAMASYHAGHAGSCDGDSVEDSLWGGAPGASWSASRVAAMDASELAEHDAPTLLQLDQEGKGAALEVFVRDGLGEPFHLDATKDDGLIWAPILRSGMLATRPGPNGEKKHDPLVFVPGYASDPRKEIGLQNLLDSFDANAIQHVTIPTSHDNGVLDNTGFVKKLKIVDSTKRPGEKVLVAAHDFKDPIVREKVKLGTIANRSCGIVYDYVNTETGAKYEQAIDHVALTNKPWVTGMAAYGETEFGDREVVPMMLSERPGVAQTTDEQFDSSPERFEDGQWARSCIVDLGEGDPKARFALPIREPDGTFNAQAISAAAKGLDAVRGATLSQKKAAARTLIAAHRHAGQQPPQQLLDLVAVSTSLSDAERNPLTLADVQWGADVLSMNDINDQVVAQLADLTVEDEIYPIYSVLDVAAQPDPKALVRVNYGDPDGVRDACVIPLEIDGNKVTLADFSKWTFVQQEWVTDEDAEQDKQELGSILGDKQNLSDLHLGTLSAKERNALPDSAFALPGRQYPIHDVEHARNALARVAQNGSPEEQRKVRTAVYRKFPQLKKSDSGKTNMSDSLKGGAMPKPTMTQVLERLSLSEEQREALAPLLSENEQLRTDLAAERKKLREDTIKARVQELQGQKFTPGFCRTYEEMALGDDGMVAGSLNLSDEEGNKTGEKEYTLTQALDRLISALPRDDSGALALADRASLLTSPITDRPPLTAEDQRKQEELDGDKRPQTADEWLAEAEKSAPGLAAQSGLSLSTEKKEG